MFKSPRDPREAKLLVRVECGVLMAMFMMQLGILVLSCCVHLCYVREYEGLEAEREMTEAKRKAKTAESKGNMAKIAENKYGHLKADDEV